ncbi:MAG: hypothetical protein GWP08_06050 [Nitrospiraceae bacterium]|nr:hypothetical protein [Nitrospiraceae bacterium]
MSNENKLEALGRSGGGAFFSRLMNMMGGAAEEAPSAPSETPGERFRLAACAILLEIAHADDQFAPAEREHILQTLCQRFDLSHAEAEELMEASSVKREASVDLWHFTRAINESCSREEKIGFMEEVWRVIYADGTLDAHEDYLVHKLAKLLNLAHPDLIDAKMRVLSEIRGQ